MVKGENGKPVESAAVVFHPIRDNKDEGGMELKTNEDGQAILDVIPIGDTLRLQVIKSGYQTFGNDYPIKADTKEIVIHLQSPSRQYSIYEKHNPAAQQGGPPQQPAAKPAPENNDSKSPDAKNQTSDRSKDQTGSQQDAQSSSGSQPSH
uniref:Carboxypeptidase regulatory-like domain-containing protein n=1 Tax=Paracidobacterium acidisoli TaxID=2303751 RepID=A0A372IR23_9BACT